MVRQPMAGAWTPLRTLGPPVLWVGLLFNLPILWQRLQGVYAKAGPGLTASGLASELLLVLSLCALVLGAATLLGRWSARLVAAAVVLASAACAYYMIFFGVVIGFGVISAVLTTDHDLSREVVGLGFVFWWVLLGWAPLVWWWRRRAPASWWREARAGAALLRWLGWCGLALLLFVAAQKTLHQVGKRLHADDSGLGPNMVGVSAHAYVPSNWLAGVGMVASQAWQARRAERALVDPAQRFTYQAATPLDKMVVVFVIGETARYDRLGLLGHDRDTTPLMQRERNLAAFAGKSCDTVTKLSLACMFVRPEGVRPGQALAPDTVLERDVFSVYRSLGFRIDLFAMQSEAGFYNRTGADFYKFREVIAAQPENAGHPVDDMLLVPELARALAQHEARSARLGRQAPQLVILHTKGSHHLYSQRYPRAFARWTPECASSSAVCSSSDMLNAFDNSILYTDHVLGSVRDTVRGRRALVIYSSDHGESIDENAHFHGTPKRIAPPEQLKVPLVFWASDGFLADPVLAQGFTRLKGLARTLQPDQAGHHNLFASMLGCIGVTSPDGGVTPDLNLCR